MKKNDIDCKDVRCPGVQCHKLVGGLTAGTSTVRFYCRHCRLEIYVRRDVDRIEYIRTISKSKKSRLTNGGKSYILSKTEIII